MSADYLKVEARAEHIGSRPCRTGRCRAPSVGRGLCKKHYSRWYRRRSLVALRSHQPVPRRCRATRGCRARPVAKGLCWMHYQRRRRARLAGAGQ